MANMITRFHNFDHIRTFIFRIVGLKVGAASRTSGHFTLEYSLRKSTTGHVTIGENCFLGYQCRISAAKALVHIGNRCNIGPNVSIETVRHRFNHQANKKWYNKPVSIHDNVWTGLGCTILPGVTIGQNSIVAAGAVVAKDVPEGVLAGGVPPKPSGHCPNSPHVPLSPAENVR